ncbi:uncharacterized protein LOC123554731, partial [Mercenaria mercenaria]|uniref:uncharacterized protein LOC123554731 n=1 Tax=Mercenaria mercenaria TaxID=6596 RepID=UPI00234EA3D5
MAVDNENKMKKGEAKDFLHHFAAHWNSQVSCVANRTMKLRAINKTIELPRTDDIISLKQYLVAEIQSAMKNRKPEYKEYVKTAQMVLVRIVIFNKRRISEVAELKVEDFGKRIQGDAADGNEEILSSLDIAEKTLCNRMQLVEVRGKSTRSLRKVFVLLTTDMVEGLQYLLCTRIYAGVNPSNLFLFGNTSIATLDGCEAMRICTSACPGHVRPDLIRTRLLRRYMATTCQVMDMSGDELKLVADHMGHSLEIHTNIYKTQNSILERTKVAKALIAMENGELGRFRGRMLESIDID